MDLPLSASTRARAQRAVQAEPIFRAKAPLRVSFAGGGTDVAPFPEREGGRVLSATINRHAHALLRPREDGRIRVESLDLDTALEYGSEEPFDARGPLGLVQAAIRRIAELEEPRGFDLFLHTAAPPGSGLGASSSLIVCLIGVLAAFHKLHLSEYEVAQLAFAVERIDVGVQGGLQDQYAAAVGGFNYIQFGERVVVNPLRISDDVVNELESNLLLCFTGATRRGDRIIEDQTSRYIAGEAAAIEGLRAQKELADALREALLEGRLTTFGELLDQAWRYKRQMSPRISTPAIDAAYKEAIAHGALGGKVTGAGGGGFMLFYCRPGTRHRVSDSLRRLGVQSSDFAFDQRGLRTWTYVDP